jgi:hypothetical protein
MSRPKKILLLVPALATIIAAVILAWSNFPSKNDEGSSEVKAHGGSACNIQHSKGNAIINNCPHQRAGDAGPESKTADEPGIPGPWPIV